MIAISNVFRQIRFTEGRYWGTLKGRLRTGMRVTVAHRR
jgi:hypothetical protein